MKHYLFYGHGGAYNHGAEASLICGIKLLRALSPGCRITVSSHFPKQDIEFKLPADEIVGRDLTGKTNEEIYKATLKEYLEVYKNRTSYLCEKFPSKKSTWEYFNWSFMISMVEKVVRLELPNCEEELEYMKKELITNKEKFLNCHEILDFEIEWVEKLI